MLKRFIEIAPYVGAFILVTILSFLLGRYIFPKKASQQTEELTSRTILQSVSAQGFLVTQLVVGEQKVTYKIDKGTDWSNFWWGHEVTARATTSTAFGIDLARLQESGVHFSEATKTVCFEYPTPLIQSVSLVGDIEVKTQSGVLKKLFASDTGNDYNLALTLINDEARKAVSALTDAQKNSFTQADKLVGFLFAKSGVQVVSDCR